MLVDTAFIVFNLYGFSKAFHLNSYKVSWLVGEQRKTMTHNYWLIKHGLRVFIALIIFTSHLKMIIAVVNFWSLIPLELALLTALQILELYHQNKITQTKPKKLPLKIYRKRIIEGYPKRQEYK